MAMNGNIKPEGNGYKDIELEAFIGELKKQAYLLLRKTKEKQTRNKSKNGKKFVFQDLKTEIKAFY